MLRVSFVCVSALPIAVGLGTVAGDGGSIAGAFVVNNALPEGAGLAAVLYKEGAASPAATQAVAAKNESIAFVFPELGPGAYKARLVATREGKQMPLAETDSIELTRASMRKEGASAKAIGTDGTIAGAVTVTGTFPKGKLVFVSARRGDMTHKSYMPDRLNNASFEVAAEEAATGQFRYSFEGLSYGVFRVELTSYDYNTHKTESHGAYAQEVVVDLDHRGHSGKDFSAAFGRPPS